MGNAATSPTLLVLSTLLLAVGLVALVRGLRGRRIGTDPHCRNCRYNLTGLTSAKCPECGTTLGPKTVLIGKPARRKGSLAVGIVMMLAAAGGLGLAGYGNLRRVNWYVYYPDAWLISAADRDVPRAISVLSSRVERGKMSPFHVARAVDVALRKQGGNPGWNTLSIWDAMLAQWYAAGALDAQHADRYFLQLTDATLEVRPLVVQGDPVVLIFSGSRAGSSELRRIAGQEVALSHVTLQFLGTLNAESPPLGDPWGVPATGITAKYATYPELEPGIHTVRVQGCWEVLAPPTGKARAPSIYNMGEKREAIWSREFSMERPFVVSSADEADPIHWINDPTLQDDLASRIRVHGATAARRRIGRSTRSELFIRFNLFQPLPVDVAFEATLLTASGLGPPTPAQGSIVTLNGRCDTPVHISAVLPALRPDDPLYVLLTPSREVVARSLATYSTWSGTLLIGPIEIAEFRALEGGRFSEITREEFFELEAGTSPDSGEVADEEPR